MEEDLHLAHFRFLERGSGSDKQQTSQGKQHKGRKIIHSCAAFPRINRKNTGICAECQASTGLRFAGSDTLDGITLQSRPATPNWAECIPESQGEPPSTHDEL